jgi:hypothetical protein
MNRVRRIAVTPTVDTVAYTAGDVVGGLMTFAVTPQGFDGEIKSVLVTDAANQKEPYTLYVFNEAPTTFADQAAFMPTAADLNKLVTTVTVGTADYTTSASTIGYALLGGHEDTDMAIPVHSDNGDLYIYAVAASTPDYTTASDLVLTVTVDVF